MPLPAEFAALSPFADWALSTEPERYAKRLGSTMPEMQAFYDAAFPLLPRVLEYLGDTTLTDLSDDERTLMHLMQGLVMVSFPVEVWKQARVPDSGAAYLDLIREPVV
jgi:hypothetical protein